MGRMCDDEAGVPLDDDTTAAGGEDQAPTLVQGRRGRVHLWLEGTATVCGATVDPQTHDTWVAAEWAEQVRCYNCAYRHTPPGYLRPRSSTDFPLRPACPQHPHAPADSCHLCDPEAETAPATGRRSGEHWSDPETETLLELLAAGHTADDIASRLGRTATGIRSRCRMLLPGPDARARNADLDLQALLADNPSYDWRTELAAAYARQGVHYWGEAGDKQLRTAWHHQQPMHELVDTLDASEPEIAARLIALELATDTAEVVATLGARPGGTLHQRARLAADRRAAAVWVLIADGLRGTPRARDLERTTTTKVHRHVSVHATRDDADTTLARLLAEHDRLGGHRNEVTITVAERTVAALGEGATHHAHSPSTPAPPDRNAIATP